MLIRNLELPKNTKDLHTFARSFSNADQFLSWLTCFRRRNFK